ncbi:MAG: hypothetical protein FWE31_04180 [Firmicutes bacterium]|nr:hypothetical protein [Bacillota bacterium]
MSKYRMWHDKVTQYNKTKSEMPGGSEELGRVDFDIEPPLAIKKCMECIGGFGPNPPKRGKMSEFCPASLENYKKKRANMNIGDGIWYCGDAMNRCYKTPEDKCLLNQDLARYV